jgi:hypothetical protein
MFDSQLFADDLDAIFNDWDTADYTQSIYSHPSSNTIILQGIFHYDFIEVNGVVSNRPTFRVRTGMVLTPSDNDRLTVTNVVLDQDLNSTDFVVREYERWGNGETLLILSTYDPP